MRGLPFGLGLLALWSGWGFALQGWLAASPGAARFTPDLGVVLLLALEPKMPTGRAWLAAVVVAAARIALSVDPPLAILVGYALVVGLSDRLRRVVEIDRPLPRALLAGFLSLVLMVYWAQARSAVLAAHGMAGADPGALEPRLGVALATAVAAVLLAPLVLALPGISLLTRWRP